MHAVRTLLALSVAAPLTIAAPSHAQSSPSDSRTPIIRHVAAPRPSGAHMLSAPAPLSPERLDRYAKALKLDPDQTTAARALYDTYVQQTQRQQKEMRRALSESTENLDIIVPAPSSGSASPSRKLESIDTLMREHESKSRALRDQFLADLKSLLHADQQSNWSALERLRRRDNYLARGSLSGSTLDLLAITDALKLSPEHRAPLDPVLTDYEINLDRALVEREQFLDPADQPRGVQTFDGDAIRTRMKLQREVDAKVKEVNLAAARQLAELVPAAHRPAFDDLVKRHTFRSVYKPSSAARKLQAAQSLKSLSTAQRDTLTSTLDRYQRDADALNQRWADAIARAESNNRPTGSGPFSMGEKLDSDLVDARKARRELDGALKDTLKTTLTPEQMEELAPPSQELAGVQRSVSVHAIADGSGAPPMTFVSLDEDELDEDDAASTGGGPAVIIIERHETSDPNAPSAPPAEQPAQSKP